MIYDIIKTLRATSSKNDKISILQKHIDNETLKSVLVYTYSPLINFYTKHQVDVISDNQTILRRVSLDTAIKRLDDLANRKVTGNASKDFLNDIAIFLSKKDKVVLNYIIARDLDCGINVKTINKVFPNLIPTIPYMRCAGVSGIVRIKFPAIIQRKADGIFCNTVVKDGKVKFFTRNGTEFSLDKIGGVVERFGKLVDFGGWAGTVLNGELLVTDDDGYELSRKEGNGLINSLIKKEQTLDSLRNKIDKAKSVKAVSKLKHDIDSKEIEYDNTDVSLKYVIWDILPYDQWVNGEVDVDYETRFSYMENLMEKFGKHGCFHIIETKNVNNLEEAQDFYQKQIENGYEGAVLKNLDGIWKNHTSPNQVKMKAEHDCDLKIIGIKEGMGKYTGKIGSLDCASSDGLLKVNVGSGLTDADREKNFSELLGKIITVKYNEVIDGESKNTKSLFLPRVAELVRIDKTEADSLEKILKG